MRAAFHLSLRLLIISLLSAGWLRAGFFQDFFKHDLEVITVTDVTPAGKDWVPPTPDKPVYYIGVSYGYKDFGGTMGGDKLPPDLTMKRTITKVLAKNGFLPATQKNPATLIIIFAWGTMYTDSIPIFMDNGQQLEQQLNHRAMMKFLGGDKVGIPLEDQSLYPMAAIPGLEYKSADAEMIRDAAREDLYVAALGAYEIKTVKKGVKPQLIWRTKISAPSRGLVMADSLPTMIEIAGPTIGHDTPKPVWTTATDRFKAEVKIGDTKVDEYLGSTPLPVLDGKAFQKNKK